MSHSAGRSLILGKLGFLKYQQWGEPGNQEFLAALEGKQGNQLVLETAARNLQHLKPGTMLLDVSYCGQPLGDCSVELCRSPQKGQCGLLKLTLQPEEEAGLTETLA